jgi:ribosomal protein L11 methyltransferase
METIAKWVEKLLMRGGVAETMAPYLRLLVLLVVLGFLAFGTGHHPTTRMMLETLLDMDAKRQVKNRRILDLGTGTGILAILAAKMGAAIPVHALDNDLRCVHSCTENARRNRVAHKIQVHHADASFIQQGRYGLILANIHRNILSYEMDTLSRSLEPGTSHVLLSGFVLHAQKENEGWSLLHLTKP